MVLDPAQNESMSRSEVICVALSYETYILAFLTCSEQGSI